MLRAEKLKTERTLLRPRQKGSILIGLIITMVVMASLGAGMVYLTTTSTFNELFANNNARAYYAAESGGRYALSVIRDAYATDTTGLKDKLNNQTFTMNNNGGQFRITNFIQSPGDPATVTFTSTGTVNPGSFLQAKRQIRYDIQPANQGAAPPPSALPPPVSDFNVPKADLDQYFGPVGMGDVDIKNNPTVDGDPALNLKSAFYTMGLKWYENPSKMAQLDLIRRGNGGLLSYGVQVKIKVADNTSSYNIIGISFRLDDSNTETMTEGNMYGISFVKMPDHIVDPSENVYKKAPYWYKNYIHTNDAWNVFSDPGAGNWFVVLWKRVGSEGGTHTPLAYKKLTSADWACKPGFGTATSCTAIRDWATILVDVEEKMPGDDSTRYNVIKSYLPEYTRFTGNVPQTPLWGTTNPIIWTSGALAGGDGNIVEDNSLTTLNYNSYTPTTNPKAREIGLHIYCNSEAAQNVFYDNFYIDLSPSWSGGADGDGGVIQY